MLFFQELCRGGSWGRRGSRKDVYQPQSDRCLPPVSPRTQDIVQKPGKLRIEKKSKVRQMPIYVSSGSPNMRILTGIDSSSPAIRTQTIPLPIPRDWTLLKLALRVSKPAASLVGPSKSPQVGRVGSEGEEEIRGFRGGASGADDGAVVLTQNLEPGADIVGGRTAGMMPSVADKMPTSFRRTAPRASRVSSRIRPRDPARAVRDGRSSGRVRAGPCDAS